MTLLDTAMSYGAGHNERLIGAAIAGRRRRGRAGQQVRDRARSRRRPRGRPPRAAPRGYCEASLARLGADHLDLYYLHRVDPEVPVEETIGAMADLVAAGKVRHLGCLEATAASLSGPSPSIRIAAVQMEWSLTWREWRTTSCPPRVDSASGLSPTARWAAAC